MAGLRDYAVLSLLARLGLRAAEAAGCSWAISTGGPARSRSRARAAAPSGSRCLGRGGARRLADRRTAAVEPRAVFVSVRRPYRELTPEAVRAVMGRACERAGLDGGERTGSGTRWRPRCCAPGRRCPRWARSSATAATVHLALCQGRRDALRPLARPWPGTAGMSALRGRAAEYLAMRRALGFELTTQGRHLRASSGSARNAPPRGDRRPGGRVGDPGRPGRRREVSRPGRLDIVRIFARHLKALDPATEVPPEDV